MFHFHVTQIKRSAGQSAVAAAAYRAGEKQHSEYYGEDSDYTRKGGVICSEILLPSHAPSEYADRETLWNAVEKAERRKKAQLAYSFDIALQNEFSMQENRVRTFSWRPSERIIICPVPRNDSARWTCAPPRR